MPSLDFRNMVRGGPFRHWTNLRTRRQSDVTVIDESGDTLASTVVHDGDDSIYREEDESNNNSLNDDVDDDDDVYETRLEKTIEDELVGHELLQVVRTMSRSRHEDTIQENEPILRNNIISLKGEERQEEKYIYPNDTIEEEDNHDENDIHLIASIQVLEVDDEVATPNTTLSLEGDPLVEITTPAKVMTNHQDNVPAIAATTTTTTTIGNAVEDPIDVRELSEEKRACRALTPDVIANDAIRERPPIGLYLYGDDDNLSPYECLMRKQLEFYEPPKRVITEGRSGPIPQSHSAIVGIRCRHCAHHGGDRGASAYPVSVLSLGQAAHSLMVHHVVSHCVFVTPALRHEVCRLLQEREEKLHHMSFGERYWFETAKLCEIGSSTWPEYQPSSILQWKVPFQPKAFGGRRKLTRQYYNYRVGRSRCPQQQQQQQQQDQQPEAHLHQQPEVQQRATFIVNKYRRKGISRRKPFVTMSSAA